MKSLKAWNRESTKGRRTNEQDVMSEAQFIKGFYAVATGLAGLEMFVGYRLRRSMRLPALGFITLGAIQAFLVLLFRYGDTWFPQPPASDLGGQTFLQPMVVALDMLITVVALPSLVLWVAIKWIIKRRRMNPQQGGAPYSSPAAGSESGDR